MNTFFLSCDWGTSNLRLSLIDRSSLQVLARTTSSNGIRSTFKAWQKSDTTKRIAFYQAEIRTAITQLNDKDDIDLSGCPLVLSGMASASIGMKELPYADLPAPLNGSGLVIDKIPGGKDFPHDILLVSGLQKPGDVMRGEEVQAIGWNQLKQDNLTEYLLILPGTHSKHIRIKEDRMIDFTTFMTGELYELLCSHSILSDSVKLDDTWNSAAQTAFADGVEAGRKEQLTHLFFSIRARGLQGRLDKTEAAHYLSGLLIGNELAAVSNLPIALCCPSNLHHLYACAIERLKIEHQTILFPPEKTAMLVHAGQRVILENRQ